MDMKQSITMNSKRGQLKEFIDYTDDAREWKLEKNLYQS